ncbi:hypothetical protein DFJ77DRAFT_477702 [Powellomyces hirtus]|nr:hypothetical protein DFJ77DRAFT_477702 [Powellomyces hirtus]
MSFLFLVSTHVGTHISLTPCPLSISLSLSDTAVFCSWILHNIHLIRVIAQHTPRNLSMPALKTAAHPNGANNAFELHHSCQATKFAADPTSTTTTNTTTTSATCTTHHGRETESRERFLVLPGRSSRLSGEKVRDLQYQPISGDARAGSPLPVKLLLQPLPCTTRVTGVLH